MVSKALEWLLFSYICVSLLSVKAGAVCAEVRRRCARFSESGDDDTLALTENAVR